MFADLDAERAFILLWIAAEHAQSGAAELRSTHESLKRAAHVFQVAAGCLSSIPATAPAPLDAQAPCLAQLMLAQAQECFWQKAVMDALKDTTIAKLAEGVATLYANALGQAEHAALPREWVQHMECKCWHFAAAAAYRKSCDDAAHRRHADELGRLQLAATFVERARRAARSAPVVNDVQSLHDIIRTNAARAEKDNQLIYLEAPTNAAHLPDTGTAMLVKIVYPAAVQDPLQYLQSERVWFARLFTYGIDVAMRLYTDRKAQFLENVLEREARAADERLEAALQQMHIVETLERLEAPQRLPEAWNEYAQQVGRHGVHALYEQWERVARKGEVCRAMCSAIRSDDLLLAEYARTLDEAAASDRQVREKLDRAQLLLHPLEKGRTGLHAWAMPVIGRVQAACTAHAGEVRGVRAMLEALQDGAQERHALVMRARAQAEGDDVHERLVSEVRARRLEEGQAIVQAASLHDVLDERMRSYDVYVQAMQASTQVQGERLSEVRRAHARLLRHADIAEALDAQVSAWHDVDEAYAEWRTLQAHMREGAAFYDKMHEMLGRLQEGIGRV